MNDYPVQYAVDYPDRDLNRVTTGFRIFTVIPILILLGTITGMISAFGIVSEAGLGQPHAVTGGIAEALIATATGLLIAIMTLIPYNYFRSKVEQLTDLLEEQSMRLELLLGKRED